MMQCKTCGVYGFQLAEPDECSACHAAREQPAAAPSAHAQFKRQPPDEPTATWWARRWFDNATPDERAAMRDLLAQSSDF